MYSKKNIIKVLVVIILIFLFLSNVYSQSDLYANITYLNTRNGIAPTINYDDESKQIDINEKILPGATIITTDKQWLEISIYKEHVPIGMLLIMENTDFRFYYNEINKTLDIRVIYGGIRGVLTDRIPCVISSETVEAKTFGADFCLLSASDEKGKRKGYATVFNGNLVFSSKKDKNNSYEINSLQVSDFYEYTVFPPRDYKMEELDEWHEKLIFKTKDIPDKIDPVLETFSFEYLKERIESKDIADATDDKINISDATTDRIKKTDILDSTTDIIDKGKISLKEILLSLATFEAGAISYNGDLGVKFALKPGFSILNDNLEFGFYLPVFLVPYKIMTDERFMKINKTNNEWSFGTDQNNNIYAMIFDICNDFLLKHRIIRYGKPDEMIFMQFGDYFNVSDFMQYTMADYNSKILYPRFRSTSFAFKFKLDWVDAFFYAEDVMPKGLYGMDLSFMTPFKSFRFRGRTSTYIDCYDLMKFEEGESFFPSQFNATLSFDAFDVKSLTFSVYLSCGYLLPFSHNFYDDTSSLRNLYQENPTSLIAGLSANAGYYMRIMGFKMGLEFIVDSGLNKVGLYDTIFFVKREFRGRIIEDWLHELSDRPINMGDFNFGFRAKLGYNFKNFFFVESVYKLTFVPYYDNLQFKIGFDSNDMLRVNFKLYGEWDVEVLGVAFSSINAIKENNIFYFGGTIYPYPGINIDISTGMTPQLVEESDPWYKNFSFDFSVTIIPLELYRANKDNRMKRIKKSVKDIN